MGEQSPEEAFAELSGEFVALLGFLPYDNKECQQIAEQNAIRKLRNLALAVAAEYAKLLHDPPLGDTGANRASDEWTWEDDEFVALRTRIEALGGKQ